MTRKAKVKPEEIAELLRQIESGVVTLECRMSRSPQDVYAGDVTYHSSNGWVVVIFNDCNDWDYVDSVVAPDGRVANFEDIYPIGDREGSKAVQEAEPTGEVWDTYGIPGYLRHRDVEWPGWKPDRPSTSHPVRGKDGS